MSPYFKFILLGCILVCCKSCVYHDEVSLYGENPDELPVDSLPTYNIWKGPKFVFEKKANLSPELAINQDRLTERVWITRSNEGGQIYNIRKENSPNKTSSPIDTEWALGTTEELGTLNFKPFREAVEAPRNIDGRSYVLHLITDDIYIDVKFLFWSNNKTGQFKYERSTP